MPNSLTPIQSIFDTPTHKKFEERSILDSPYLKKIELYLPDWETKNYVKDVEVDVDLLWQPLKVDHTGI